MKRALMISAMCGMLMGFEDIGGPQLFVGTPWHVESAGEHHFKPGLATFTLSREGAMTAFAGCNMMGADYTLKGTSLAFKPVMGTQMACADMADEQALGAALGKGPFTVKPQDDKVLLESKGVVITLLPVTVE